MQYEDYELMVKGYFEKVTRRAFKRDIFIEHQKDYKTGTGQTYNIDLSYEFRIGQSRYLTILECKCWQKQIERDHILALDNKKNLLGAHKAIAVSPCGFQSGAIALANEKGIGLYKIETSGQAQNISHFTGNYATYKAKLLEASVLRDQGAYKFGFGIISPNLHPYQFIWDKYGVDISELFSEDDNQPKRLNGSKYLPVFPNIWSDEYELIETSGTDLVLENENLIRTICFLQRIDETEME